MDTLTNLRQEPFVANEFGDRYLESVNQAAFRRIGYEEYLREHFGSPPFQEGKLYVIIGTDSGLLIKFLQKFGLPARSNFLLLELPEVLSRLEAELAVADLGPRLVATSIERMPGALGALRFSAYARLNQLVLLKSFGAMDGNLPGYGELYTTVREKISSLVWEVKGRLLRRLFMERRLANLGENRTSVTTLTGLFPGKTAIVLGGGPSLDEILPWLQENRRKLVVFAAGRISGRLRSLGITPDFVLTIDPNPGSFDNSRESLYFWQEASLIHSEFTIPPLLGQWRGRSFYGGKRYDWHTPHNDERAATVGLTVTNFAVDIGVMLGFRRILLAGVDFCFSQSGVTHAQGSLEHSQGAVVGKNLTVSTNAGGKAESKEDFIVACEQMGKSALQAQTIGCEIINLAPGAAVIDGVSHCLPVGIEFRADEYNSTPQVIGALASETCAERTAHYQAMLAELARARDNLSKIDKLFKHAEAWKATDRLAAVENALSEEQRLFYRAVTEFGSRDFMMAYSTADLDNLSEAECKRVSKLLFKAFADSVGEFLLVLGSAEQRLKMRLQEEQESPDFEALAAQWRADGQPGRVLLWEDRFPLAVARCAEQYSDLFKALKQEYTDLLTGVVSLRSVPSKKIFKEQEMRVIILELFKKKDQKGLERVSQSLAAYDNETRAIFVALARAQAAELAGADQQAAEEYEAIVVAGSSSILEDALVRIVALALKSSDQAAALRALEHLSRLSMAYEPRYAEALAVVGDHERALAVYADYLDKNPTDISTLLRLGRYYQQLNHPEGARFVFGQVLELEPGNLTAATLMAGLT